MPGGGLVQLGMRASSTVTRGRRVTGAGRWEVQGTQSRESQKFSFACFHLLGYHLRVRMVECVHFIEGENDRIGENDITARQHERPTEAIRF